MLNTLTALIVSCLFSLGAFHPIHISKCQVEHDRNDRKLRIILHVFADDLEKGIEQQGIATDLKLGLPGEKAGAHEAVAKYISSHLRLSQKGEELPLTFIRMEKTDDDMAFWCFLETGPVKKLEDIKVEYDLLMEVYDDQKNIFNIISRELEEKYHLFKNEKQTFEIDF